MMSVETISRRGFLAAGAVGAAMVGVGGFGAAVEFDDGVEDGLVAGLVEVLPAQHLGDDVGGLGRQHHRSEDAHLRVDVLRGDAVELVVGHRDPFGSAGV